MSHFMENGGVGGGGASIFWRIPNLPLLELLSEYMDANRCMEQLLKQLEAERRNVRREKLAVARLQREIARCKSEGTMREKLIHELEEERRLRLESEKRLREVKEESELGRAQMVSLQQQFSRMEETVRSLLQGQGVLEQVDTVDIMKAYKDKLSEDIQKQQDVSGAPPATQSAPDPTSPQQQQQPSADVDDSQAEREVKDKSVVLLERLKALEEENSVLASANESQREQYERCLDEVANQVVQALLTQKDLREECLKLRTRVFDLEQQNRALGILFQQKIKPASDLLLQKLHSRIMDLSAVDLLLEPERSKAFLLSRNSDSPSSDLQLNGKPGLYVSKCLSQLSLAAPAPMYPRSSCSSSELSLSSACSEFSSGSYTWNDGQAKMSSLTWEKRLSLGSSAPTNICAAAEETRQKENHILEGLRKLQRRKHRSSSCSSRASKSGYKDCMNSNEGIYSLGVKSGAKGVAKVTHVCRASADRKFAYDSDDADDELAHSGHADNIPTKDGWFSCKRRSRSISESLCSWEGTRDAGGGGDSVPAAPSGYDSKEHPEKLMSFINSFLPEGGRPSAFHKPSKLHFAPSDPNLPVQISQTAESEEPGGVHLSERAERDSKRLSRDAAKLLTQQCLRRDQGRTQSADGRPCPLGLIEEPKHLKCTQSEESILAIFDAEGEPIELCAQKVPSGACRDVCKGSKAEYAELVPRQMAERSNAVPESAEKPSEYQLRARRSGGTASGAERLSMPLTPQRKLIKPGSGRASKGLSIPPMSDNSAPKSGGSKIPGRNKTSVSPLRASKGSEQNNSGLSAQDTSPLSPTGKISRFIKTPGSSSHSPKTGNPTLSTRPGWNKPSGSPHLTRKHLEYGDSGEQPTRDKHCEPSPTKVRSPSPPPPPGRSTSLLVRPNYEGSPQAHRPVGAAQQSGATRGPPPSYHTSLLPNMQSTLPIKDKDCSDLDAGYGTALSPQKLVDRTGAHLHKSPAAVKSKRTKDSSYLPPANSGCEPALKGPKNVPPPYRAVRGSSLQSAFVCTRGSAHETVQKPSISLPITLQESKPEMSPVAGPTSAVAMSPNSAEKSAKTRIPMGFKAFLKSPPSHKNIPGKQEKDHINSVSKETATSSMQYDGTQAAFGTDSRETDGKGEGRHRSTEEEVNLGSPEEGQVLEKGKRSAQLFSRSISVTTKPHLKPALGMNGAKARSQSFSANYIEKSSLDEPGKIRKQIITNSGERGSSLSRQSSLEPPRGSVVESPVHSPRSRLSHYGGMTGSNCPNIILERKSKGEGLRDAGKGEGISSPSHKEARSFAVSQFQSPPSGARETGVIATVSNEHEPGLDVTTPADSPNEAADADEEKASPTLCTIEEKVMMGIEQNLQKCQGKVANCEAKQKTGPSLANWFGLRKSKLPALGGKKADAPKIKEEKKEPRIGSVLGGKSDKKKEKKKSEVPAGQTLSDMNNKLSSIMDHCNNQMGQIATHIHCSTPFIGKEQLVKELLGRTSVKSSSVAPPGTSTPKKHLDMKGDMEICADTATLILTQRMNLRAENDDAGLVDTAHQDHMIGSGCQMRTLDSGIGTFPLPDSVGRAGGRHFPKSESGPAGVTAGSARLRPEPPSSPLHTCDPALAETRPHAPTSLGHSLSDPGVTLGDAPGSESHLPGLSAADDIRTKRWSLCVSTKNKNSSEDSERKSKIRDVEVPAERALRVCTYSGSSSDSETEQEERGSTLNSPQLCTLVNSSVRLQEKEELKRMSVETSLSIMDLYQHDVFSPLDSRRISQYNTSTKEKMPTDRPGSRDFSFESLNKLNHDDSDSAVAGEAASATR